VELTVLHETWGLHPLAWIHRAEARSVARELVRAGHAAALLRYREGRVSALPPGPLLLRLSDPVMLAAARALTRAGRNFLGPAAAVMERCYDKYEACRLAAAKGITSPATALAAEAHALPFPLIVKPRAGSDSIGVRVLRNGPIPSSIQRGEFIAQERIRGEELTVGIIRQHTGWPLRIPLPEGKPYSFARKYLLAPRREAVSDRALAERVRSTALTISRLFELNWAARIDFIYDPRCDRLCFLECDAAPLVARTSSFAASLAAAGMTRDEQLRLLLDEAAYAGRSTRRL
jgi:D-alanine-D-alanine ligase-like ATP-grasp enzyme